MRLGDVESDAVLFFMGDGCFCIVLFLRFFGGEGIVLLPCCCCFLLSLLLLRLVLLRFDTLVLPALLVRFKLPLLLLLLLLFFDAERKPVENEGRLPELLFLRKIGECGATSRTKDGLWGSSLILLAAFLRFLRNSKFRSWRSRWTCCCCCS